MRSSPVPPSCVSGARALILIGGITQFRKPWSAPSGTLAQLSQLIVFNELSDRIPQDANGDRKKREESGLNGKHFRQHQGRLWTRCDCVGYLWNQLILTGSLALITTYILKGCQRDWPWELRSLVPREQRLDGVNQINMHSLQTGGLKCICRGMYCRCEY